MMVLGLDTHAMFYFLGTLQGELVKHSVELLFFTFITYMVVSEYTREHRRYLKYMSAGFGALSFWKFVTVSILTFVVYGGVSENVYRFFFPVVDNALEVLALIFLTSAFIFPFVRGKINLKRVIYNMLWVFLVLYVVFQIGFVYEVFYHNAQAVFVNYHSTFTFTILKIVLLIYAIVMLSVNTKIRFKYRYSVIVALSLYLVNPILDMINIAYFQGFDPRLIVAAQPFPLLAMVMFTRVIYLKLVDKAYLQKQLEHEKEINRLKDQFVSVVSHELRTPLTSIGLYCSLLDTGKLGRLKPKQKDALSVVRDECRRLNALVTDILDLSKLEGGRVKLEIKSFKFAELCEHKDLLAEKKGIKIDYDCPKDIVVKGDRDKLKQVLINLVSNAVKYSDDGKTVKVKVKKSGPNVIFSVKDEGYGISDEEVGRIFDKFYQVANHMTRKVGGTGLGLAIVKEIVELHKGKIDVKSKVGKGTTFTVTLPS